MGAGFAELFFAVLVDFPPVTPPSTLAFALVEISSSHAEISSTSEIDPPFTVVTDVPEVAGLGRLPLLTLRGFFGVGPNSLAIKPFLVGFPADGANGETGSAAVGIATPSTGAEVTVAGAFLPRAFGSGFPKSFLKSG